MIGQSLGPECATTPKRESKTGTQLERLESEIIQVQRIAGELLESVIPAMEKCLERILEPDVPHNLGDPATDEKKAPENVDVPMAESLRMLQKHLHHEGTKQLRTVVNRIERILSRVDL